MTQLTIVYGPVRLLLGDCLKPPEPEAGFSISAPFTCRGWVILSYGRCPTCCTNFRVWPSMCWMPVAPSLHPPYPMAPILWQAKMSPWEPNVPGSQESPLVKKNHCSSLPRLKLCFGGSKADPLDSSSTLEAIIKKWSKDSVRRDNTDYAGLTQPPFVTPHMGAQRQAGRQNAETISIPIDKKEAARKSECV